MIIIKNNHSLLSFRFEILISYAFFNQNWRNTVKKFLANTLIKKVKLEDCFTWYNNI